ncbi:hypothetical protein [Glaciecola sp. SC05]|uniref:hypothetical protein n=1 Tax=Glaciecola sp. SC05 TaxID=1987355 RepID=UPI003528FED1
MSDSPQFIVNSTEGPGYGTISTVYGLLFKEIGLPSKLELVPLNRQNRILEQTEYAACSLYRFKNDERAQKYEFSEMVYFLLHYKLYQQAAMAPLSKGIVDENGAIESLSTVFTANSDATLLVMPSYSYGSLIDRQLAKLPSEVKIEWTGANPHNRLSSMFFNHRADYALMFPAEVAEYVKNNPDAVYRRYEIANVDSVTRGHMMCNKHPDSSAYIKKVNQALPKLYQHPDYQNAHTNYYDKSEHETILKFIAGLKP